MFAYRIFRAGSLLLVLLLAACTAVPNPFAAPPDPAPTVAPAAGASDAASATEPTAPDGGDAPPPPDVTTTPEPAGKLVFASDRAGAFDIYTINEDGSALANLTNTDNANDTSPAWSPDGEQIAFISDRTNANGGAGQNGTTPEEAPSQPAVPNLYRMNADGSEVERLTNRSTPVGWPAWSPDGEQIAFLAQRVDVPADESEAADTGDTLALFVVDVETGAIDTLREDLQGAEHPSWSPDGTQIVLSLVQEDTRDIYLLAIGEDRPLVNLTNTDASDNTPIWSPDGSRIAFVSNRNGNSDIFAMNADGSAQTRLTTAEALDSAPTWAPDNSRIAFVSNRNGNSDIFVVSDGGDEPVPITNDTASDTSPHWQPQPPEAVVERLIFASAPPRAFAHLAVVNVTGSNLTNLTENVAFNNITPAWSPDGTRVAFASDRNGAHDIFVLTIASNELVQLTTNPATDMHPTWSPDGSRIGFESNRDGNWDIFTMNPDGTDQANLSNHPANDGNIAWSPDGTQIAFVSDRDGNLEIYVMNDDGSELQRLTSNAANDVFPDWSPDGTQLVFRSNRPGNNDIYRMNVNGLGLRRLTSSPANDDHPAWSPDGTRIAFVSNRVDVTGNAPENAESPLNLYVMGIDGRNLEQVTDSDNTDRYPDWLPTANGP